MSHVLHVSVYFYLYFSCGYSLHYLIVIIVATHWQWRPVAMTNDIRDLWQLSRTVLCLLVSYIFIICPIAIA